MEDEIKKALELNEMKKKYDKIISKLNNKVAITFDERLLKQAWEDLVRENTIKQIKGEKNARNKS